tara:strand:- start:116 stop:397 length:282 start_codon:yes stop_codon:yes gene_type:complete
MSDKEVNETMIEVAEIYSENLPMEIDKATTLIQIFAGLDRDIVYKYSVKVKPAVLKDGELRNYFKDNNITMEHNYVDINNRYLFDVRISSKFC